MLKESGFARSVAVFTSGGFISSLAMVLENIVKLSSVNRLHLLTRFHAVKCPEIAIKDYLERIQKYFACSNECFVLSLIYIDRIVKLNKEFTVTAFNVHRLLLTAVMLATKFFDDVYYSNAFYARVGGVRTSEINILETHFLSLLDFQLYVTPQEYEQYRHNVIYAVQQQQVCSRSSLRCCDYKVPVDGVGAPTSNAKRCAADSISSRTSEGCHIWSSMSSTLSGSTDAEEYLCTDHVAETKVDVAVKDLGCGVQMEKLESAAALIIGMCLQM